MSETYLSRILVRQLRLLIGGDAVSDILDDLEGDPLGDAIDALAEHVERHAPAGWQLYYDESTIMWQRIAPA